MIRNKFLALILGVGLLVGFSSCEDYFGDINVNPNAPTDVTPEVLLPNIQVRLSFALGGDFSRFTSIITQQVEGLTRQWASINNYSFIVPANFNTAWRTNIYAGVLQDLNVLKEKSVEEGSNYYTAIANVMLAYTWMSSTDVWNDMPYTEAFQGTDNLQPAFDSQEFIYGEIFSLLNEAKTLLAGDGGGRLPAGDDILYGGDAAQWLKFAHALAARGHLNIALTNPAAEYRAALDELPNAFASTADDALLPYGAGATSSAPWYQFNRDRGDIQFHPTIAGIMTANGDPRLDIYNPDFTDFDNHPFMVPDRQWPFLSYAELKFLEAEAVLETGGDAAQAHAAYREAITASMEPYGFDAADVTAFVDSVDPGQGNVTLEDVITQKYVALYTQPVVFNDFRRTGFPVLSPTSGTVVPVRFPYAETEILFNPNTPDVNIFTDAGKVWWDRN